MKKRGDDLGNWRPLMLFLTVLLVVAASPPPQYDPGGSRSDPYIGVLSKTCQDPGRLELDADSNNNHEAYSGQCLFGVATPANHVIPLVLSCIDVDLLADSVFSRRGYVVYVYGAGRSAYSLLTQTHLSLPKVIYWYFDLRARG